MTVELLHKADLCLLLNRLVGRAVLTYAECVVRPDKLDRELHQGCHTHCWLHVVREYEEGTAGRDDTSVESHTYAAAGHGKLRHTSLEECAAEIVAGDRVGLLEESVGLVGVGKVR